MARHKKGQVLDRSGIKHHAQFRVQRDCERLAGLVLADVKHAIANVLAAELDDIGAALRGVEKQGKG